MWIAKTIDQARHLRREIAEPVAMVPTMGALHRGHMWLVEKAKEAGCHVVVSIFVNPTQFGPGEDYDAYPRQLDQDLAICQQADVAGVFCPSRVQIYPSDAIGCELTIPALANPLEGQYRPGHFAGVCRVVAKLLNIIQPEVACFGQKDYQQLKVVEAMVTDLAMPVQIMGVPTVRQDDGLAVSSRNVYLSPTDRHRATSLYKALDEARTLIEIGGESDPSVVERAMAQVLRAYRIEVDYAVIRHRQTLVALDCIEPELTGGVVALIAGRIGGIRLIDNMMMGCSKK